MSIINILGSTTTPAGDSQISPLQNDGNFRSVRLEDVALHVTYWVIAALYYHRILLTFRSPEFAFYKVLFDFPVQILFAYAHIIFVVPLLTQKKHYLKFIFYSFCFLILMTATAKVSLWLIATYTHFGKLFSTSEMFSYSSLLAAPLDYAMFPGIFIMLYIARKSYRILLQNQALTHAKKEAEIKLLKSQINPHFLFNTLNNLYGMCLSGSKQTADSVYQLSNIMQYMVFESNKDTIPLHKELEYIENYISLEQIRYGERLNLSMNVNIPSVIRNQTIAPLLFLPFLENAFKHGAAKQDGNVWIVVSVSIVKGQLRYYVKNSCKASPASGPVNENSGLKILQHRLAQIYPGRYFVSTEITNDIFTAKLEIDLYEEPTA